MFQQLVQEESRSSGRWGKMKIRQEDAGVLIHTPHISKMGANVFTPREFSLTVEFIETISVPKLAHSAFQC